MASHRTTQSGVSVIEGAGGYATLLNDLRRDLQLDASTDLAPGTLLTAELKTALPYGQLLYNSSAQTAPNGVMLGQFAGAGWAYGGMLAKNFGGARGWELVVPITGTYRITFHARIDYGTVAYTLVQGVVNGASNAAFGYGIEAAGSAPYHNLEMHLQIRLTAGASYNVAWGDGVGGTATLEGGLGWLMLQWIGPLVPQVF